MKKMIIEARVNEYAMREENPNVPWTPDEIVESAIRCREAGASILHFHGRNNDGSPDHSVKTYAEIIRRVRQVTDLLIIPTLGFTTNADDPESRIGNIAQLASDPATKPEIAPTVFNSVNLEFYDSSKKEFKDADYVYNNTTATLQYYAKVLRAAGVKQKIVVWDVGALRRAAAFLEMGFIDEPAYIEFWLSEGGVLTSHPCNQAGLEAYIPFLPEGKRCEWTVYCSSGNLLPLVPFIAKHGGHISIGIGDYPFNEFGQPTNEEIIQKVVEIARNNGRETASPQEAREMLGL